MKPDHALVCLQPGPHASLVSQALPQPRLGRHQVLVRVTATSINPIDTKRAQGYGRRLLGLIGAGGNAVVLGNDFAGHVVAVGPQATPYKVGDQVYGVLPTGRAGGAHKSTLVADARYLRPLPKDLDPAAASVLPYTFCTLWQAFSGLGLDANRVKDQHILVHGGSGALGQMAIQVLAQWGGHVTATCSAAHADLCRSLGAETVVDRHQTRITELPAHFDVTLNFGSWSDDAQLVTRLRHGAIGHATTVHPLMSELDQHGWLRGLLRLLSQWRHMRKLVKEKGPQTRYAWVLFKPSPDALDTLAELLRQDHIHLDIAMRVPFSKARRAFQHVANGSPQRAVLLPNA
ncbi:MAG: alcohol dehydrogenase catalytic domain-containing protein [Burkholderiales bacterium]|nr:alcohol dehydrogenase catalytic domain-containing protein [Burkholderiales bacterium]